MYKIRLLTWKLTKLFPPSETKQTRAKESAQNKIPEIKLALNVMDTFLRIRARRKFETVWCIQKNKICTILSPCSWDISGKLQHAGYLFFEYLIARQRKTLHFSKILREIQSCEDS